MSFPMSKMINHNQSNSDQRFNNYKNMNMLKVSMLIQFKVHNQIHNQSTTTL